MARSGLRFGLVASFDPGLVFLVRSLGQERLEGCVLTYVWGCSVGSLRREREQALCTVARNVRCNREHTAQYMQYSVPLDRTVREFVTVSLECIAKFFIYPIYRTGRFFCI
jgi:hypothetical protein